MNWPVLALRYLVLCVFYLLIIALIRRLRFSLRLGELGAPALSVQSSGRLTVNPGEEWVLNGEVVIGRDFGCTINLPDPYVSTRHARIYETGGKYRVEDLGSSNGTLLNGKPLVASQPLRSGDTLQVGQVVFRVNPSPGTAVRKGFLYLSLFPALILIAGGAALYFNQLLALRNFYVLMAVGIFLSAGVLVSHLRGRGDAHLFLLVAVLSSLGLIFLYRIDPVFGLRQSWWVVIGSGVFWLTLIVLRDYTRLIDYKYLMLALGIIFLILTITLGITAGGARSWLGLGSFRFQPSEFVKIFMVIFLAGYLEENREILKRGTMRVGAFLVPDWHYLGPLLAACGLSLLLLVFQRDLGMALLFFTVFLAMVYAATGRVSYLLVGMSLFLAGAFLMYLVFPHVQLRIAVYLNPWQSAAQGGYQILQSLFALGGGGFLGWGLGSGFPELIPAVHTDLIFSLLAEEMGLAGTLGIVFLYALLIWHGFCVALKTTEGSGSLLAFGFSSLLALQTLIILGGVTNLIPLTGIPLPFLSYGGSSFVSNCFLIGLLTKVSEDA